MGSLSKAFISEIFFSFQGEGPLVGTPMVFVRFCGCNFKCRYCDTIIGKTENCIIKNASTKKIIKKYKNPIDCKILISAVSKISNFGKCNKWISITGGEPLEQTDFLNEFLKLTKEKGYKIYLETNGVYYKELQKIAKYIDFISMDIKIPSSTKRKECWNEHKKFITVAKENKIKMFYKLVLDSLITDNEIKNLLKLIKEDELIIQPVITSKKLLENINKLKKYYKIRVIPQTHKYLNIL